jgi:hypothetical protein
MLNDTDNIYFYRVKSRDAAGRLTGHIVVVLILVIFLLDLYKT